MGAAGRRRIEEQLAWNHQEPRYLSVFDRLLGRERAVWRADASHAA
jgi:hypothetical protein